MRQAIEPVGESKSDYEVVVRDRQEARHGGSGHRGLHRWTSSSKRHVRGHGLRQVRDAGRSSRRRTTACSPWPRTGRSGRPASASSTRTRRATRCRRPPASSSSTRRAWPRPSPTTRSGRRYPQWIEKGVTHDERISSKRAQEYPLLVMSNHGRWRVHAQCDDIPWTREVLTGKVKGFDGYMYEPCWMHPYGCRGAGASRTATSSRSTTSAAACSAAPSCGSGSCRAWSPSTTARAPTSSAPRKLDRGGAINTIAPEGLDLQERRRPGDERLSGRGREGQHGHDGRVEATVPGGLRPRVRPGVRPALRCLGRRRGA